MPVNSKFFDVLRLPITVVGDKGEKQTVNIYGGQIPQQAVDGIEAIVTAFDGFTGHEHCTDDLAYILATALRETGDHFNLAIEEIGRGKGKAYGVATGQYKQVYYGRGPVQITWLKNYAVAEKRTGIPFVQHPEYMCIPKYGVVAMLDGMYNALFTKYNLRSFIKPGVPTTYNGFKLSRQIVNGLDHAGEIALNALVFQRALGVGYTVPAPTPVVSTPPKAPTLQKQQQGLLATVARWYLGQGV